MKYKLLSLNNLTKTATVIFVFLQIFLCYYWWGIEQYSDQISYVAQSVKVALTGVSYPSQENLYDQYIVAPGMINLYAFFIKLTGTANIILLLQVLMNIGLMFEVKYIANKLFGNKTANLTSILFALLYSNYASIAVYGTEIPFLFFAFLGLCFILEDKWYYYVLAGLLFFIANTIRPIIFAFIIGSLVYMFMAKCKWYKYLVLLAFYFIGVISYGQYNKSSIGYPVTQSTTGGINLILSASEHSDGTTTKGFEIFLNDSTDIGKVRVESRSLDVMQKDEALKKHAISWIISHPIQYAKQLPKKTVTIFADESWPDRIMADTGFMKEIKAAPNTTTKISLLLTILLKSFTYYLMGLFFICYLWVNRKHLLVKENAFLVIFVLMLAVTLAIVAMPRYHYPLNFIMVIYAAHFLAGKIKNEKTII
jgi:hypothetical protein